MPLDAINLTYDPVHGYIPFVSGVGLVEGEVSERQIIDDPWLQRMRQIHQLQTAWWVYPSAEHTRFPHVIGAMHLGSRVRHAGQHQRRHGQIRGGAGVDACVLELRVPRREGGIGHEALSLLGARVPALRRRHDNLCHALAMLSHNV